MARTKQTPRNPNIDRPVVAVGSDIQSAERRPTLDPHKEKSQTKEANSQENIYQRNCCTWVPHQQEELKNPIITDLVW